MASSLHMIILDLSRIETTLLLACTANENKFVQQESIKDKDDRSVPIVAPPRTQLQLVQGHHIVFGIIDL